MFLSALLAASLAAPVPKAKGAPPPFPLTVGDTREYEWRAGDKGEEAYTDVVTRVDGQKDASTRVTVRRSYPKGTPSSTVIGVSAGGLTRVADGDLQLAKPQVLLKLPAEVGTEWEEGETKYEVTAVEEVAVGAGKYKAAKVEMSTKGGKTTLWFAPGVGLVRMTSGGERALELKAFTPGK
jgi:hypothetical protein